MAQVAGRLSAHDGGGGWFRYDANISTYEDGGIYFEPNNLSSAANGRWVRLYNDHVNVLWYGAAQDGSTDDRGEIQDANDAAATLGLPLMLPQGTYAVAVPLVGSYAFWATTSWYSEGGATLRNTNLSLSDDTEFIRVHSQDGLTFSQIHLDGQITKTGSSEANEDHSSPNGTNINNYTRCAGWNIVRQHQYYAQELPDRQHLSSVIPSAKSKPEHQNSELSNQSKPRDFW